MKELIQGYEHFKRDEPMPYLKDTPDYYLWMAGYELARRGYGKPRAWLLSNQWKGWGKSRTHGKSGTPTHMSWGHMIQRCRNPKNRAWSNYGGRGIRVCERWNRFENFLADMGEKPAGMSLERINVNGNYEPSNCKWATTKEQSRNKRSTVYLTHLGKTVPLSDWAEETGIEAHVIYTRILRGWSTEDALTVKPSGALKSNNTTGFPGVYPTEIEGRWTAQISTKGKVYSAGRADSPKEAYALRIEKAAELGISLPEGERFL